MAQVGNGADPAAGDQQRNEARRRGGGARRRGGEARRRGGEAPVAVAVPAEAAAPAAVPAPPAPAAPPAVVARAQAQAAVVAALGALPNVAAPQVGGAHALAFDVDRVLVRPGPLAKRTFGYVIYPPIPDDEAA